MRSNYKLAEKVEKWLWDIEYGKLAKGLKDLKPLAVPRKLATALDQLDTETPISSKIAPIAQVKNKFGYSKKDWNNF